MPITHAQAGPLPLVRVDGRQQHTHNIVRAGSFLCSSLSALLHASLTAKVKEEIDCIRELEQTEMHMKETTLALIRQGNQTYNAPYHMHAW
jgi:hypothetical protein